MNTGPFKFPTWMGPFPRNGAPWSDEETARAVSRWREGASTYEISVEHGRKEQSVVLRLTGTLGDEFMKKISPNSEEIDRVSEELILTGYRRISNKHLRVARIDRPDWGSIVSSMWKLDLPCGDETQFPTSAFDFYRRMISKDVKVVSRELYSKIPNSIGDRTGYIEVSSTKE